MFPPSTATFNPNTELMELLDRIAARDAAALKALYVHTSSKLFGLEPKGGVPSAGGPTGPVLFTGALIQKLL